MITYICVCRNRASGTPSNNSRKGANGLPKIASSPTRPRSHSSSLVTGLTRGGMLATARTSTIAAAGAGQVTIKRQRRTSSGGDG